MHLATLVTNTDSSDFAKARPLDDEKFAQLVAEVRPDWNATAFWACRGDLPDDWSKFDGVLITGSPASVTEAAPWMIRLEAVVRDLVARGVPLFGACFGHQIIAKALGAPIIRNPEGWSHGLIRIARAASFPWSGDEDCFALYGSHIEQVGALPKGATCAFKSPSCPIAGFALGHAIFTVQHHPEMTAGFIQDLIEEYAELVGNEATTRARHSVAEGRADRAQFAAEMARFFEQARR